jgi:hypothetical protein
MTAVQRAAVAGASEEPYMSAEVAAPLAGVRSLGVLTETLHAVVYFAPEARDAYAGLGLKGYWRGYFASRAAALGPVGGETVAALFAGVRTVLRHSGGARGVGDRRAGDGAGGASHGCGCGAAAHAPR